MEHGGFMICGFKLSDRCTNQGPGKIMLAVCSTSTLVQMIQSVGSDVKLLALSPSPPHVKLDGDVKEPTH